MMIKTRIMNVLSMLTVIILFCGLLYLAISIRTASYGMTPLMHWPFVAGLFMLFSTVCAIPLLVAGFTIRKSFGIVVCIGIAIFVVSESVAGVEEYMFRRHCRNSHITETVFQERWWPFHHHYLGYNPTTQRFFGGD